MLKSINTALRKNTSIKHWHLSPNISHGWETLHWWLVSAVKDQEKTEIFFPDMKTHKSKTEMVDMQLTGDKSWSSENWLFSTWQLEANKLKSYLL